jgi:hypothetical protein
MELANICSGPPNDISALATTNNSWPTVHTHVVTDITADVLGPDLLELLLHGP